MNSFSSSPQSQCRNAFSTTSQPKPRRPRRTWRCPSSTCMPGIQWCLPIETNFIERQESVHDMTLSIRLSNCCWLVVWKCLEHEFYDFPFSWEFHPPNCRSHIFQRGRYARVETTNQVAHAGLGLDRLDNGGIAAWSGTPFSSQRIFGYL